MKRDSARVKSDKILYEIEKRIKKEYNTAHAEITEKWNKYLTSGQDKIDALYNAYVNAPDDEKKEALKKYQQALENYTLKNERFKDMEYETAQRIANANKIATEYVNNRLAEVYSINLNYKDPVLSGINISFTLVDESTVRRMIKDGDVKLPYKKLNVPKDIAWNTKKMSSAILQGILQGESMKDISKRLLPIIGNNQSAAIRNARTLVTGAENRGRQDRYEMLEDGGLIMYKCWIATGDGRTRDWHLEMDGQEVEYNEKFHTVLPDGTVDELEYPGDPDGEPANVYNCRCSMRGVPKGIRGNNGEITWFDVKEHNGMHQREIEEEKEARGM